MISIITVCYNSCYDLIKTIRSICNQESTTINLELVIVDGGSSDDTEKKVKEFLPVLINKNIKVNFQSEKDNGIYDAMNKGAVRAEGTWCIYLNAGDRFACNDSLKRLIELTLSVDDDVNIIYGDTIHYYRGKYKYVKANKPENLSYLYGMEFCHQSCLIRKKLLLQNRYSENYRIAGDYDFFVKAFISLTKYVYYDYPISIFEKEGISSSYAGKVNYENACVAYKYKLINKKKYYIKIIKAKVQLLLRKIVPASVIVRRREQIMKDATKKWINSVEECIRRSTNDL